MNKVILIGNLSKDVDMRKTGSGKAVASFTVAVNRRKTKDGVQEADFINCVAWEQLAELVGKYMSKGRKCAVTGRLQTRSYDAQDGSKRFVTEVLCEEVEFLPSAGGAQAQEKPKEGTEAVPYEDDDLPF